jgi:hypothetical protein
MLPLPVSMPELSAAVPMVMLAASAASVTAPPLVLMPSTVKPLASWYVTWPPEFVT